MKTKRFFAVLLTCVLMISVFAGCGKKEAPAAEAPSAGGEAAAPNDGSYNVDNMETLNLKICSSMKSSAADTPGWSQAAVFFANEITARSNGKVTVTMYPDGQLGSSGDEMISGVTTGAFEFCTMGSGAFGEFTDGWMDFNLPFLFNSQDEVDAYIDGVRGEAITQKVIDDIGVRVLCFYDMGYRHTTSNKPIHTADDFKALKIRTQSDPYQMATFEAMGASVSTVAFAELFSALQQGVVDAQENPTTNIIQQKFYEIQDYLTLTGHNYGLTSMCVSEEAFQSWSTDVQNLILEVAKESTDLCREGVITSEEENLAFLKGVCEVYEPTEEEVQTFKDATASVYDKVHEAIGDERYNAIIEEVSRIRGE